MSPNTSPTVRRQSSENGLTLTEMLTVCALIVILLNLSLGIFERVREVAWLNNCMSNLRQSGIMLNSYQEDNHGFLPEFTPKLGLGDRDNWFDLFGATDSGGTYFSAKRHPIYGIERGNITADPRLPRILEDYSDSYEVLICPGQGPSAYWKDVGPYYYNTNNPFRSPASIKEIWHALAKRDKNQPLAACQNPKYLLNNGDRGWRHGKRRGEMGANNFIYLDGSVQVYYSPAQWYKQ